MRATNQQQHEPIGPTCHDGCVREDRGTLPRRLCRTIDDEGSLTDA
jgi:hypothetical protein